MKLKHKQKGLALVEFAIVAALLLTIVFAICELGIVLYDKAIITNASREAARSGIVLRTPILTDAQIQGVANNYCLSHLVGFPTGTPTVTVAHPADAVGNKLQVDVTYNYRFLVLNMLTVGLIANPLPLRSTSTMYYE